METTRQCRFHVTMLHNLPQCLQLFTRNISSFIRHRQGNHTFTVIVCPIYVTNSTFFAVTLPCNIFHQLFKLSFTGCVV